MKALAVFHDHGGHVLDRWLKPGFRHVFCALASGEFWIRIDAQAGCPVIEPVATADYDLAAFYRAEGFTVVEMEQRTKPLRWPLMITNCVGLVKMVLCIKAPLAVTPYGLYRHMTRGSWLPGKSVFIPRTPINEAFIKGTKGKSGMIGLLGRFAAHSPARPPAPSSSTTAAPGVAPLQRKLRKGRSAILVPTDDSAALLGRPTAKLGG